MGSQRLSIDRQIGSRVRTARLASDLPQATFATMLGVSSAHVARLEAGEERISSEQLTEIAATLGQTVSFFFQEWIEDIPRLRPLDRATLPLQSASGRLLAERDPDLTCLPMARPYLQ